MAKKELYYFCVSVDNGVKPRTNRPHYYGFTIATSESDAQSKAVSYIHQMDEWKDDPCFNCIVESVKYNDTKDGRRFPDCPDTVTVFIDRPGEKTYLEPTVYGGDRND